MRKKYLIGIVILFGVALVSKIVLVKNNSYESNKDTTINNNLIAMNFEQNAGKGDYKEVAQSSWPTEGYVFNSELSRCENGSTIKWDNTKNTVVFEGNISDKCYVYFDIARYDQYCNNNTLACYTAKKFTGTQGDNGIYYHDSSLTSGAGDNSYRYAGANPNNYVCFGSDASTCPDDNLYRIIGVIDGKVKLIKYDYANSNLLGTDGDYSTTTYSKSDVSTYKGKLTSINTYKWSNLASCPSSTAYNDNGLVRLAIVEPTAEGCNKWNLSEFNTVNLNTNYINNIGESWANKIDITTWKVGGNTYANISKSIPSTVYKNEITTPAESTTYNAKIGLMYASDYGFAASPSAWTSTLIDYDSSSITSVNWMYMGIYEWTISRISDSSYAVFRVYTGGTVFNGGAYSGYGVRPSFNLTSSTSYVSGSGSMTDPIRIN